MAVQRIIEIIAQTVGWDKAKVEIDDTTEATKELEKAQKDANKSSGFLSKGIKGIGTALKGLGIGAIVAVFALFTQALSKNQRAMDAFSKIANAASIIIERLFSFVENTVKSVNDAGVSFGALGKVMKGLVTLALTPIVTNFNLLKLGLFEAQLAWESSFLGGKDQDKIDELNTKIDETKDKLVEIKDNAINAGKDVASNFGDAVNSVIQVGNIALEEGKKTAESFNTVWKEAGELTELQNNFGLLEAQQERLATQYLKQAEELRQIRDDETASIADRIKANQDLQGVIDKQIQAEQGAVQARINGLLRQQQLEGETVERTEEIFRLQTELLAIEETAAGFRSEALTNQNSLKKESIELSQAEIDGERERKIQALEFAESQAVSETQALELRRERLALEQTILAEKQKEIEQFKEGTQARIEAEQEWLTAKQELDEQELLLEEDKEARRKEILGIDADEDLTPAERLRVEKEEELAVLQEAFENELVTEEEFLRRKAELNQLYSQKEIELANKTAEEEKRINAEKASSTIQQAQQYIGAVSSLTSSFLGMMKDDEDATVEEKEKRNKRKFKIEKGLKMGEVALATALGISNAVSQSPMTGGLPGSAIAGATGIAQLAAIAGTKYESPNIDPEVEDDGGGATEASPDIQSIFGEEQENLPDRSTENLGATNQTIRAVVVESDITDTQDSLTNIENGSEL